MEDLKLDGMDKLKNEIIFDIDLDSELNDKIFYKFDEISKEFLKACTEYKFQNKSRILKIKYFLNYPETLKFEKEFQLINIKIRKQFLHQDEVITEQAAISINILVIKNLMEIINIDVLRRGQKADYKIHTPEGIIPLECKGASDNCNKAIHDAKDQVIKSFLKLGNEKIPYGLGGSLCLKNNINYIDKLINPNHKKTEAKRLESDEIESKRARASLLVSKASTKKLKGEDVNKEFLDAAEAEAELAQTLEVQNSSDFLDHWISAISCFIESENFSKALKIIREIEDRISYSKVDEEELNELKYISIAKIKSNNKNSVNNKFLQLLIKRVLFEIENKFGKIKSTGVIMKILFELSNRILCYGYFLPIDYYVNKNPTYSNDLNSILQRYLESKFLIKNQDDSMVFSEKSEKMMKSNEKSDIELIKSKFTDDFYDEIIDVIEFYGNKTSKELMQIEKEKGISQNQYGRPL